MSAERDLYINAVLINGLPTCVFPAVPYHRQITNIVLSNGVSSSFACYRGQLSSVPVAQNSVGVNQTVSGKIPLPAGQQFFVQWSAAGSPVSSAFARVSSNRIDNPLDDVTDTAINFAINAISTLVIPTGATTGARIILDGTTGDIFIYDATNTLVGVINSSSFTIGVTTLAPGAWFGTFTGTTSDTYVGIDPTGGNPSLDFALGRAAGVDYNPGFIEALHSFIQQGRLKLMSPYKTSQVVADAAYIDLFSNANAGIGSAVNFGGGVFNFTQTDGLGVADIRTSGNVLHYDPAGTLEIWKTLPLVAGWTGTFNYRRIACPPNSVQIYAAIVPGTKVDGTTVTTMPAAYIPPTTKDIGAMGNVTAAVGGQIPHFNITAPGGAFQCYGLTAATAVTVNGYYPVDL